MDRAKYISILCLWVMTELCLAGPKQPLLWLKFDYAPMYILSGEHSGQGIADKLVDQLLENMPEFQSDFQSTHLQRLFATVEKGPNVCSGPVRKNQERDQRRVIFTNPVRGIPRLRLLVKRSSYQKIAHLIDKKTGELSIKTLLDEQPDFVLSLSSGRSYGEGVDQLLQTTIYAKRVSKHITLKPSASQFQMLSLGRISGFLEYPWLLPKLEQVHGQSDSASLDFISVPVAEAKGQSEIYFICSKTPEGRKIANALNGVLKKEWPNLLSKAYPWLDKTEVEYVKSQ